MDEQQEMMEMEESSPSPEQAMESMEQERMAQIESIAAASPELDKPMKSNLIKKLVSEVNKLIDQIDESMQEVDYEAEEAKVMGQFPIEVFVPVVIIFSFVSTLGDDFEKYIMDPSELSSEAGVRKAIAILKKMANDKQLLARMQKPAEEEEEMEEEEEIEEPMVQPVDMDEDDQAMMNMM